jgi:hypothetical protein
VQTAGGSRAFRAFPGRSPPTWARRAAPRAPRGRSWRVTARWSAGNATPDFTPRAVSFFLVIFGYFWLFLVIFWLFLVIFGYFWLFFGYFW